MSRLGDAHAARVGAVLVVSLIVLAGGIWILGDAARLWSPKIEYRVKLRDVQGLSQGSSVALAGYRIGTVKRTYLPENIGEGRVVVVLSVERANKHYIRADTKAKIKTLGLLGDRYIELSPGSASAPELEGGAEIEAIQPTDIDSLLAQGETVADSLVKLTTSLRSIVEKIDKGEGVLGKLLNDTPDSKELLGDLRSTVAGLREVTDKVNRGQGVIGSLLNDKSAAQDLKRTLTSLSTLASRLEQGESLLGRLLSDPEFGRQVSDDLEAAAREVRALTERLNSGQGLAGRLLADDETAEAVLANLRDATGSFAAIARSVEAGEGSLGKLIRDDTLYEGVNDILAGARRSRLLRWFITRSQKAGIEERERAAREPSTVKVSPYRTEPDPAAEAAGP